MEKFNSNLLLISLAVLIAVFLLSEVNASQNSRFQDALKARRFNKFHAAKEAKGKAATDNKSQKKESTLYDRLTYFKTWPTNTASYVTAVPVNFTCSPQDQQEIVAWSRQMHNASSEEFIMEDGLVLPGFQHLYEVYGNTNIRLKHVDYGFGQRLRCTLLGETVSAHAYMTVPEFGTCNETSFILGQWAFISCNEFYTGLLPPVKSFYERSSGVKLPAENVTVHNNESIYRMNFIAEEYHHMMEIHYQTHFTLPPPGLIPVDNQQNFFSRDMPMFSIWTDYGIISLKRGPHQLHIWPYSKTYYAQEIVECIARGNPLPDVHWTFENDFILSDDGILVITADMEGLTGSFICNAFNNIDGIIEGFSTLVVNATVLGIPSPYQTKFDTSPVNTAAIIGTPVEFQCSPDSLPESLYWARMIHDTTTEENVIYNGIVYPEFQSEYNVSGLTQTNLVVKGAAGQRVKCGLIQASVSMHAYLITLDSDPVCEHNITNEDGASLGTYIYMHCSVNYTGLWAPVMTWGTMDTTGDVWSLAQYAQDESTPNTVRYSVYMQLSANLNETIFMCKTHFLPPPDGSIPDGDPNTLFNRHAPSWTHYYKTGRFYLY